MNSLLVSQNIGFEDAYLLLVDIKEVGASFLDEPSLACDSSDPISVDEVLSSSDLESLVLFNDDALFNGDYLLLDSWNVGSRAIDEPLISGESLDLMLCVCEVSDALDSES